MAESSKTPFVTKQSGSTVMLNIKANQNLILDLNSSRYFDDIKPMIEWFSSIEGLVDPESNSSAATLEMFFQIRYLGENDLVSKFKKPNLPPIWNGLFTLLFNSFSKQITGCVADVNLFLQNLVETCDSLLTVSVCQHIAEKIKPIFSILNRIEGVLECGALPKQRGESKKPFDEEPKKPTDESGKGKLIDSDKEEEEDLSEGSKLKRKKRDQELDENLRVEKEVEIREKEPRDAQITLKTQRDLFLPWLMERILKEAIDNPKVYSLEPVASFELENTLECQLDFPITVKAFLFCCFDKVEKAPNSDNDANLMLISIYLWHGKPQYQTWSSKKITAVKVFGLIETNSFINARFKASQGASKPIVESSLAYLSCLNPYYWISLFNFLSKDEQKFEPIVAHLKRMLVSYIQEIGKMDVEIMAVLWKKPTVQPKEALNNVTKIKFGRIQKDNWSVTFQESDKDGTNVQKCLFSLLDKHLYSTSCLNYIVGIIEQCKTNVVADKKCPVDMIK
ncbi:unnamed protein product [Lactuca saligna]|uniref:Uncharacterized protein n=1 Tax=Lactuca saligna TaxID=75948 RepID=A0AA35Z3D7_LACSI|nr:unnamed protein product [Lactuca saligna]